MPAKKAKKPVKKEVKCACCSTKEYGNLETSVASFEIGRDYPDGSSDPLGFTGLIDEVEVCSTALSDAEIQQHYENGLRGLGYYAGN